MAARRNARAWADLLLAVALGLLALCPAAACRERGADAPAPAAETPSTTPEPPQPTPTAAIQPSAALTAARTALREGRTEDALALFLRAATDPSLAAEAYLGAVSAALEGGDREQALRFAREAVDAAEGPWLRGAAYRLARLELEAGDPAAAERVLAPLLDGPLSDPLQPRLLAAYAEAAARLGNLDAAARAWAAAIASPASSNSLRASIYRRRAELAAASGDGAAELHWRTRLVALDPAPQSRYELAHAAARLGDGGTFAQQLRTIIAESPGSRYALLAIADLRAAGVPVDPGDEGYVYYRHRAYANARDVLSASLADQGLTPEERQFRLYYLAASYDDAGLYAESIPYYDEAAALVPDSPYAHRARYWAARAAEAAGRLEEAIGRYADLARDAERGEFTSEAAFRAGYLRFLAGDAPAALALWSELGAPNDPRTAYWRGRALQATGDAAAARAAFEEASTANPFDLYAREARRALGQPVTSPEGYRPLPPVPPIDWAAVADWLGADANAEPLFATGAEVLLAIGLRDEARAAVADALESARTPTARFQLLREAAELGLTDLAARIASELLARPDASSAPPDLWRLAYPLDFGALLDDAARAYDFDPLFLAALIRQESFWNPDAVSIADAIGLTQVIPSTGEGIAAALGIERFEPGDLRRPAVAVRFGAHYLAGQLDRFEHEYQALAAYNAGPGSALRWMGEPGEPPVDYVERISFVETRGYVERVIENYERYLSLYPR